MCTLIQMGPWTSVAIINVSLLVGCPDFKVINVRTLIKLGLWTSVLIINTVSLLINYVINYPYPCLHVMSNYY